MNKILERISGIGIVPVVTINQLDDALPMAKALYNGGLDCAEITFRSPYAVDAIKAIHAELPDMLLGAGTVGSVEQAMQAVEAGANFLVTPGFNDDVVKWALTNNIMILPGISTASEIEHARSMGLHYLKFFPAESSGGAKKLKDLSSPYQDIKFMPTGGVNAKNLHDYLSLNNVFAAGGSFMLPKDLIEAHDWSGIESLVKQAVNTMLGYELIHLGVNSNSCEEAKDTADKLCNLFGFKYYKKPKSHFAGRGFEILNAPGRGEHGHIGIYTPYPERAIYHLNKKGINIIPETITRNKKSGKINFVYLDYEIAGFGIHLINPDVKM